MKTNIYEVCRDILTGTANSNTISSIIKLDKVYEEYVLDKSMRVISYAFPIEVKDMSNYKLRRIEMDNFINIHMLIKDGKTLCKVTDDSPCVDISDTMHDYLIWTISEMVRKNKLHGELVVQRVDELTEEMIMLSEVMLDKVTEDYPDSWYGTVNGEVVVVLLGEYYGLDTLHVDRLMSVGNGYGKQLLKEVNKKYNLELYPLAEVVSYYEDLGFTENNDGLMEVNKYGIKL